MFVFFIFVALADSHKKIKKLEYCQYVHQILLLRINFRKLEMQLCTSEEVGNKEWMLHTDFDNARIYHETRI